MLVQTSNVFITTPRRHFVKVLTSGESAFWNHQHPPFNVHFSSWQNQQPHWVPFSVFVWSLQLDALSYINHSKECAKCILRGTVVSSFQVTISPHYFVFFSSSSSSTNSNRFNKSLLTLFLSQHTLVSLPFHSSAHTISLLASVTLSQLIHPACTLVLHIQ